jgi:hypothetical protein
MFAVIGELLSTIWISRSTVEMRMERGVNRWSGRTSLAEDLAALKANLLTSEGCDLSVIFEVEIPSNPKEEVELRLMLYGLDMLTPYQSPIVQLRLLGESIDATAYLLEQINCWEKAHRLLEVQLYTWRIYGWTTISQSLVRPNFIRLGIFQSGKPGPTWLSQPATMVHLEKLVQLEISCASWLKGLRLRYTLHY